MPAVHLMSDQSLQVSARYLALGGAFLGSPSRIGSAVGMLEHAVAAAPDNWVAHANLAVARLRTGQDDLSVASSVQSIEVAIRMCIPSHYFICIACCHYNNSAFRALSIPTESTARRPCRLAPISIVYLS